MLVDIYKGTMVLWKNIKNMNYMYTYAGILIHNNCTYLKNVYRHQI